MDIHENIVNSIDLAFDTANSVVADIDDLNDQISILQNRLYGKQQLLAEVLTPVLCMCSVNHSVHGADKHKIQLIKLHRSAYKSSLRDAKDTIELYLEPGALR